MLKDILPVIDVETIEIRMHDTDFKFEITSKEITLNKILAKNLLDAEVKNISPADYEIDSLAITIDASK